jgi:glucose-1-phosphate thymidylyltransferase
MKGLILAGGSGKRLRPITHTGCKQLVPVANRPILFYVVDNLVEAGVTDIGVVVSPESSAEISSALGDGTRWGCRFTLIEQDRPGGLAHAARCGRSFLDESPFVMYLGDNLVGGSIRPMVERFARGGSSMPSASLLLKEVDHPEAFGVALVNSSGLIVSLEEKPVNPKSRLVLVGVYLFRQSIFDAIERVKPSARGELEITDAIRVLMDHSGRVDCEVLQSWWLDTGKKDDLLLANDTVLDDRCERRIEGDVVESTIVGRVTVEAGAHVSRSTIRGPVVIGAGARVAGSVIEPFTVVGNGSHVEDSTLSHSVLMEGCRIMSVSRLSDSLIGRRVVVRQAKALSGVRLCVGDDGVVDF